MPPWQHWRPASCLPDACFCEAIRDGWIRQPANTLSSLAFVAVAVLVLAGASAQPRVPGPDSQDARGLAGPFVLALLVIGAGSAFYHASLSFAGQFVDVLGMYLVATFIIAVNLRRRHAIANAAVVAGYTVANALLALVLFAVPGVRRQVFAALIATGVALELRRPAGFARGRRRLLGAVALLGAGFALWVLDITRVACAPASWAQGHAAWHVLGAAAAWQLWRHYASASTGRDAVSS